MNKTPLFVPFLFALACASDPNKEVKSAESQVNQSEVEGANKHDETTTQNRETQAAADREKRENRVDTTSDGQKSTLDARAKLADAQIKLAKEREAYNIDATTRFNKAEAKANEAKVKSAKLKGPKAAEFKSAWTKYAASHDDADGRIKRLRGAADDAWTSDKGGTDTALSGMEKAASDVAAMP